VPVAPRYSGGGYTVAQQLLTDVTQQPFDRLVGARVLEPLGMSRSGYASPTPDEVGANVAIAHDEEGKVSASRWYRYPEMAAAGLWTTPSDLARFAIEIQRSAAARSNKVLSVELTRAMLTPVMGEYGLGLGLAGRDQTPAFSHGGANHGFRCLLFAFVETGQGAVVMTNADSGGRLADEVMRAVARAYQWPGPRFTTGERVAIAVNPALYAPLPGPVPRRRPGPGHRHRGGRPAVRPGCAPRPREGRAPRRVRGEMFRHGGRRDLHLHQGRRRAGHRAPGGAPRSLLPGPQGALTTITVVARSERVEKDWTRHPHASSAGPPRW
jgi:hypothetical protein